jgi:16S rRNA (guanine966-N2)-methyltransferase
MRIVGGRLKGRVLKAPASDAIRPTSDRLRETLFNILAHSYGNPVEGARIIDLFAGTGAMAIEGISRGAQFALLVDQGTEACAIIRSNLASLDLTGSTRILRRDARKLGAAPENESFSLAFLDPPYGKGLVVPTLTALRDGGWLSNDALVVIEEAAQAEISLPEGFALIETRCYADTQVVFARMSS